MAQRIFDGRNQVVYSYGRYGYTRGGGKTWHGGLDIVGVDDTTVRMPSYFAADGTEKTLTGTVTRARIVTDKSNKTWEWGYYVCVKLDSGLTPDSVNYLYFCHNSKLLVKAGDKVKTGDALAVMGNTGNATLNDPPYKHCHFEVRAAATGKGLDPTAYCGCDNAVGVYGVQTAEPVVTATGKSLQGILIGPAASDVMAPFDTLAAELALTDERWAKLAVDSAHVLRAASVSTGDAAKLYALAQTAGVQYVSAYVG